jgi:hypothetical protein
MNAGFGSWLFGMALGAGAPGGMLGMAGGIFIALAATTLIADSSPSVMPIRSWYGRPPGPRSLALPC